MVKESDDFFLLQKSYHNNFSDERFSDNLCFQLKIKDLCYNKRGYMQIQAIYLSANFYSNFCPYVDAFLTFTFEGIQILVAILNA